MVLYKFAFIFNFKSPKWSFIQVLFAVDIKFKTYSVFIVARIIYITKLATLDFIYLPSSP